jgi:hypothetical protein
MDNDFLHDTFKSYKRLFPGEYWRFRSMFLKNQPAGKHKEFVVKMKIQDK